jgi:hypothetical protein
VLPGLADIQAGLAAEPLPFDPLDNLYALHAVKRVLSSYSSSSPLVRIRRSTDGVEQDFGPEPDGWLSGAAISSFLGGATGFVTTAYDQSGNSRNAVQTTAANQPTIDLSGAHPVVDFARSSSQYLTIQSAGAFAQNVAAATLVQVLVTEDNVNAQNSLVATRNAAGASRIAIGHSTVDNVAVRRGDGDAAVNTTGFAAISAWHTRVVRAHYAANTVYHRRDANAETGAIPGASGANTSNTASAAIDIGRFPSGVNYFDGKMTLLGALVRDHLSDAETDALVTALGALKL